MITVLLTSEQNSLCLAPQKGFSRCWSNFP